MKTCMIDLVVGTRPNIVKLSPLARVLQSQDWCEPRIVFIGQHTSPSLSDEIIEDLGVDQSIIRYLPLERAGFGARLGEIISTYSRLLAEETPDMVVVFGDVDVTLGAALAAKRSLLPLVHIEAGLRSGDRSMPEEINRVVVDSISDLFFAPSEDAFNNLVFGEAKNADAVCLAGNIMIDSLAAALDERAKAEIAARLGVSAGKFAVATFHRPSNVDTEAGLLEVIGLVEYLAERLEVVFPLHPRTEAALARTGLRERIAANAAIRDVTAMRYREFINLLALPAALVITDSGGIQEETSYLGVPCLTYRENTERPVTVRSGTNMLVNRYDARAMIDSVLAESDRRATRPDIPLWDGRTAYRIASSLYTWWSARAARN